MADRSGGGVRVSARDELGKDPGTVLLDTSGRAGPETEPERERREYVDVMVAVVGNSSLADTKQNTDKQNFHTKAVECFSKQLRPKKGEQYVTRRCCSPAEVYPRRGLKTRTGAEAGAERVRAVLQKKWNGP